MVHTLSLKPHLVSPQGINYFIDQLNIEEILGTASGNDTTLILTASNELQNTYMQNYFRDMYQMK